MTKQHNAKKTAMKSLHYLQHLTDKQILSACKLAVIRQFEPLETIYYEDRGKLTYVHFLLTGDCMILQCLKLRVTAKKEGKTFKLVDLANDDGGSMLQELSSEKRFTPVFSAENNANETGKIYMPAFIKQSVVRRMNFDAMEKACGLRTPSNASILLPNAVNEDGTEHSECIYNENYKQWIEKGFPEDIEEKSTSIHKHEVDTKEQNSNQKTLENMKSVELPEFSKSDLSISSNKSKATEHKDDIEYRFIDVGSLTPGGVFGLGEKLEHRVIMARTTVQCLLIPRYWLFDKEQNPGNVWQRRRFYLESTIPTREILFNDFLLTRKWRKFRNDLIERNIPNTIRNSTKVEDIPVICHIYEANDDKSIKKRNKK